MRRRLTLALWYAGWPVRQALLLPIRLYRLTFSHVVGGNCRFYPSCSAYAFTAIERCGAVRGVGLTAWRVLRCSPLSAGGVDHPPEGPAWRVLHRHDDERSSGSSSRPVARTSAEVSA
jgi:putative membrane protein insertion efficiency factor